MNWLKIKHSLFVLLGFALAACQSNDDLSGKEVAPFDQFNSVAYSDTFGLELTTVLLDTIEEESFYSPFVGKYSDPDFGSYSSSAHFSTYVPNNTTIDRLKDSLSNDAVIDSAWFRMRIIPNFMGDPSKTQTFYLKSVQETILNTSNNKTPQRNIPTGNTLATVQFVPNALNNSILRFKMSDEMLEVLKREMSYISSGEFNTRFIEKFPGLALVPDAGNTCSFNLDIDSDSSYIESYFTKPSNPRTTVRFSFKSVYVYNRYQIDRNSSTLFSLQRPYDTLSSKMTGKVYLQSGTAVGIRVRFPGINATTKLNFVRAELVLPVQASDSLPEAVYSIGLNSALQMKRAGKDSFIQYTTSDGISSILSPFADNITVPRAIIPVKDNAYTIPLTKYLLALVDGREVNGILIQGIDGKEKIRQTIINTNPSTGAKPTLRVYYTRTP